jgi:hypothetical protein
MASKIIGTISFLTLYIWKMYEMRAFSGTLCHKEQFILAVSFVSYLFALAVLVVLLLKIFIAGSL